MKTLTYKSPVPRQERATGNYIYDIITLYNVETTKQFGDVCYVGTTTKKGKMRAYCMPEKVLELKTI